MGRRFIDGLYSVPYLKRLIGEKEKKGFELSRQGKSILAGKLDSIWKEYKKQKRERTRWNHCRRITLT
jgi:hypothetical protein